MFRDFREATIQSRYGHIQVTRPDFHESGRSSPFAYLLPPDREFQPLGQTPGVRAITPRLSFAGLVSRGDATVSFLGEGIDPSKDQVDDRSLTIERGTRLGAERENEVLLGRGLAAMLGATAGDKLVLLVNSARGGLSGSDATVAGVFSSVNKDHEDSTLVMPISLARRLLKTQGSHAWVVFLQDTGDTTAVAGLVSGRLDQSGYEVRTWDQLARFYTKAVELLTAQLDVVRVIVAAIILLGIGNTMMMSVIERTQEIGTSMALGVRRSKVIRQFVVEGTMIGVVGGIAGVLLALVAAAALEGLEIHMPPPPGLSRGYVARVLVSGSLAIEGLALGAITTLAASFYPAWKASRLSIVDALRYAR